MHFSTEEKNKELDNFRPVRTQEGEQRYHPALKIVSFMPRGNGWESLQSFEVIAPARDDLHIGMM